MKYLSIFFLAVILVGCDTRKDMYSDLNLNPQVEIKKSASAGQYVTELSDSVKRDFNTYILDYILKDEEDLSVSIVSNVSSDAITTINGNHAQIKFDQNVIGKHTISFISKDTYSKEGKATATIEVFVNLPPVADFEVIKKAVFDPLEYTIDASGSFDRDYKYGGGLKSFEFIINNSYKTTIANNNLNYIFPSEGNYTISVRALDTDGVWSSYKTKIVTISK